MSKDLAIPKLSYKPKRINKKAKYTPAKLKEIISELESYIDNQDEEFIPDITEFCSLTRVPRSSLYHIKDNPDTYGEKYSSALAELIEICRDTHQARLYKLALYNKVNASIAAMRLSRMDNVSTNRSLNVNNIQINIDNMSSEDKQRMIFEEIQSE